jgi:putative membrane protein
MMNGIDYITLLLVNSAIGLLAGAAFLWKGLDGPDHRPWSPLFAMAGLVLLLMGLHMAATWPVKEFLPPAAAPSAQASSLPVAAVKAVNLRFANVAFGKMSVLFGALLLGVGLSMAKGWNLRPVGLYAFVVGVVSIAIGIGIWHLHLTAAPPLTMAGYVLAGAGAVLTPLALLRPQAKTPRRLAAIPLALSAMVWMVSAIPGYWAHLEGFSK